MSAHGKGEASMLTRHWSVEFDSVLQISSTSVMRHKGVVQKSFLIYFEKEVFSLLEHIGNRTYSLLLWTSRNLVFCYSFCSWLGQHRLSSHPYVSILKCFIYLYIIFPFPSLFKGNIKLALACKWDDSLVRTGATTLELFKPAKPNKLRWFDGKKPCVTYTELFLSR